MAKQKCHPPWLNIYKEYPELRVRIHRALRDRLASHVRRVNKHGLVSGKLPDGFSNSRRKSMPISMARLMMIGGTLFINLLECDDGELEKWLEEALILRKEFSKK